MGDVMPKLLAALACFGAIPTVATAQTASGVCDEAQASCADSGPASGAAPELKSVAGTPLQVCSTKPMTGWFRDGYCRTQSADQGRHVVCAEMTQEFLDFTRRRGNDLSTPRGKFVGLKSGDRWCLCALRWREAHEAGKAPPVDLEATHASALRYTSYPSLQRASSGR
jgi:uncharacterized protein